MMDEQNQLEIEQDQEIDSNELTGYDMELV